MGLPGASDRSDELTAAEQQVYNALTVLFEERAANRPEPRYRYPLSRVTYDADEIAAVVDALCSTETTMGRRVQEFEERFAALHGKGHHAVMVNSGSSADLVAALLLVDPVGPLLQPGDEVLAPAVTWPTQIDSLLMAGLSVTLVDADPTTLQMDLADLESKIGPRTRAVSAVHLMGNAADMTHLVDLCQRHDLVLLEDCCEALGATWNGQPVGTFGLAGTYSFFFSHHLTTMEGGMVLVGDEQTADRVRLLRAHGWSRNLRARATPAGASDIDQRYEFLTWGLNVRPTEASGAFGVVQLDRYGNFQAQRKANAARFSKLVAPLAPTLSLMQVPDPAGCSWFALPMLLAPDAPIDRAQLTARLEQEGIETRPVVAGNLAKQPMMQQFPQIGAGPLPGADAIHERGFYIGLHPLADDGALEQVAKVLTDALAAPARSAS